MKKAVITDYAFDEIDIEKGILEPLGFAVVGQKSGKDPAALAALVKDADAVITQFAPINAAIIGAMEKAKVIVRYGIGVDNVDLKAAAAKNIPVCNIPDSCIDEVADHPLLKLNNVVITPHDASATPQAVKTLRSDAARIAATALRGEKLPNIVNGVNA